MFSVGRILTDKDSFVELSLLQVVAKIGTVLFVKEKMKTSECPEIPGHPLLWTRPPISFSSHQGS